MSILALTFVLFSAAASVFSIALGAKAVTDDSIELTGFERLTAILFMLFGISAGLNALFAITIMLT